MVQIFEAVDEGLKYNQSIKSLVKQREKRFYFFYFITISWNCDYTQGLPALFENRPLLNTVHHHRYPADQK